MGSQTGSDIAVVGAGAIGCYFGGRLARAGNTVTLIGRPRHVDPIAGNGLLFRSRGQDERIAVAATTDIAAIAGARLILFCVKSLDTEKTVQQMAPHVAADAVILSMQNGVDNAERIRLHIKNEVMPVLVYAAAQMIGPGSVEHTGGGNAIIGRTAEFRTKFSGESALTEITALFKAAGVPVKITENIEAELWTKLVMNCAYNAICALTGTPYGKMTADPEIRAVMIEVVQEVVAVASAKGVRLPDNIADAAIRLSDAMPRTMSSTAQDIAQGRPTEIGHLNGYVARQGAALGIATPLNSTLTALTKLLEETKSGPKT
jgi:2-dehydropantoate 2-reductase